MSILKLVPLEKDIEGNVMTYAKQQGVTELKIQKKRGWPDRALLYKGGVVFIEFKRPGEKAEPLQEHVHGILRKQGFAVVVVDSVAQGRAVVDELTKICADV